ncbi:MAG TPA: hypothetical protein VM865_08560 [Acidobacteriaceae bacterium]|jgi:hypothetical protein|nr:hypothetical protein [Acidobacteriaceae bacterium]
MARQDDNLQDLLLHLPTGLRDRAEEMALRESVSLNLFVATALAEKLQRMQLRNCLGVSEREELSHTSQGDDPVLVH